MKENELLPKQGNYKRLISYQKSRVIYDITYYFCKNFLKAGDRTIDQMIQAARSGKQNIVEGCSASPASSKSEIRLLNVAKASLRELLEDYEDYLRVNNLEQWSYTSEKYTAMRTIARNHSDSEYFMNIVSTRQPGTIANMAIVLIKQTDYLLFKQLESLSKSFLKNGGFSERMTRLRCKEKSGVHC